MAKQPVKVLYFTESATPTKEDYDAAEKIGRGVMFRNARRIVPGAPLENTDAIAGPAIPPDYAMVFPQHGSDEAHSRVLLRPNASRSASSGGPDDPRPGTVDVGVAHESGVGSEFSGDPYRQRAAELEAAQRRDQRQGRPIWEKNPERALEPAEAGTGVSVTQPAVPAMGAWPTQGAPSQANVEADAAPDTVKDTADQAKQTMAEASQQNQETSQQPQGGDDNTKGGKGGKAK